MAKTDKICIVCGIGFLGTAKAECCGPTCRKKLSRLLADGKQPEYKLIGGKNTKSQTKITDLTKINKVKVVTDPPTTTNYAINIPPKKEVDRMNTPFWNELRKKKLGLKD